MLYLIVGIAIMITLCIYRVAASAQINEVWKECFAVFSMALMHFQVIHVYINIALKFPTEFLRIVEWVSSLINLDFVNLASPECTIGALSFPKRWALGSVAPLCIMSPFVYLASYDLRLTCLNWQSSKDKASATLIMLASATYMYDMTQAMRIWLCVEDPHSGNDVLFVAQDMPCTGATFGACIASSVFLFMGYFYCTNVYTHILLRAAKVEHFSAAIEAEEDRVVTMLRLDYRDGREWWCSLINMFKLLIVSCGTLLPKHPVAQDVIMLIVSFTMMLLTLHFLPHKSPEETNLGENLENPTDDDSIRMPNAAKTSRRVFRLGFSNNTVEASLYCFQVIILGVSLLAHFGAMPDTLATVLLLFFYFAAFVLIAFQLHRKLYSVGLRGSATWMNTRMCMCVELKKNSDNETQTGHFDKQIELVDWDAAAASKIEESAKTKVGKERITEISLDLEVTAVLSRSVAVSSPERTGAVAAAAEEWTCSSCTLNNAQHHLTCSACKTNRPSPSFLMRQQGEKSANPEEETKLATARTSLAAPLPEPTGAVATAAEEWMCSACTLSSAQHHIAQHYLACSMCGTRRPPPPDPTVPEGFTLYATSKELASSANLEFFAEQADTTAKGTVQPAATNREVDMRTNFVRRRLSKGRDKKPTTSAVVTSGLATWAMKQSNLGSSF